MFNHLFKQQVTLKRVDGTDSFGKHKVIDTRTILCRLNFQNKVVKNSQGVDSVSTGSLKTAEPISLNDLITYQGKDWEVIQASPIVDLDGNVSHYEVYF